MNTQELRQIAADLHRLARDAEDLAEQAETLDQEDVDTGTSNNLLDTQEAIQDEIEQEVSDLLAVLDASDEVDGKSLGHPGRRPVESGNLPAPKRASFKGGPPPWAGGGSDNPGNGSDNSGNDSDNSGNGSDNPDNGSGNPGNGSGNGR